MLVWFIAITDADFNRADTIVKFASINSFATNTYD